MLGRRRSAWRSKQTYLKERRKECEKAAQLEEEEEEEDRDGGGASRFFYPRVGFRLFSIFLLYN